MGVGLFSIFKSKSRKYKERKIFLLIVDEIDRDHLEKDIWLKALSKSSGDNELARALYIKYRYNSIASQYDDGKACKGSVEDFLEPQNTPRFYDYIIVVSLSGFIVFAFAIMAS